jgi:hypothetical protein
MTTELCMVKLFNRDGDHDRCSQTMPCPDHGANAPSTAPTGPVGRTDLAKMERRIAAMRTAAREYLDDAIGVGARASLLNDVHVYGETERARALVQAAAECLALAANQLDLCRHVSLTDADRAVAADGRA